MDKDYVLRIANPYIILRQISNLPQLRTSTTTGSGARGLTAGHHHLLAEELGDALEVRGFAAAGAGAAELEQGLCELAVTQYSYCLRIMKVGFLLLLFVCIV